MEIIKTTTKGGISNIHFAKGTHWVAYIHKKDIECDGRPPPKLSSVFIMQRKLKCVFSAINKPGKR